jgi:O-antigen/teichoic acid export membrane protein
MGPGIYGRYSLLSSLSIWFLLFSGLRLTDVIARYVPEMILRDDRKGVHQLWSDLFTVRLASGVTAASVFLAVTVLWLRDLDVIVLGTMAGMILVRAIADLLFAAFLGLNRAAHWQVGETVRQWLSVGLVVVGFRLTGLRGAVLGLLLTEFAVLALGIYWIRAHLPWPALHLDVRRSLPYLQVGLVFFASSLFHTALGASAETLVRAITGDYAQVGYFGSAWRVFITMALAIPQLSSAFIPLLTVLHTRGNTKLLQLWLERLLKYLAIGGMLASFGALLLAQDVLPVVLGTEYRPAAGNLVWLTLTLVPMALGEAASLVAVVYVKPWAALRAAAIHLVAFSILAVPFVARFGSLGSSFAMFVAWVLYAAWLTWRLRMVLRYSLREFAIVVGVGLLFLPLALLRSSWLVNACLFSLYVVGHLSVLLLTRVVTREEPTELWQAITRRGRGGDQGTVGA